MSPGELSGRRVLVTGATGAIGVETAAALAKQGASVTAVARRGEALSKLVDDLPGRDHRWVALDVGDPDAWEAIAGDLAEVTDVVCAAAALGPIGKAGTYTPEAFGATVAVNVLGALCAVHHCLAGLKGSAGGVVFFSGGGATAPLPQYDAYAASKAAVVRLAENLAVALAPEVRVNAVAPGFVASALHEATLEAGPELAGADYHARTQAELAAGGFPPQEAAELVALLLSGAARGVTGKLISAQWDPWRDTDFLTRLRVEPDLATLRRIDGVLFVGARP